MVTMQRHDKIQPRMYAMPYFDKHSTRPWKVAQLANSQCKLKRHTPFSLTKSYHPASGFPYASTRADKETNRTICSAWTLPRRFIETAAMSSQMPNEPTYQSLSGLAKDCRRECGSCKTKCVGYDRQCGIVGIPIPEMGYRDVNDQSKAIELWRHCHRFFAKKKSLMCDPHLN